MMSDAGLLAWSARRPRRSLQMRLALLYAGFFFVCGIVVFVVPVLTAKHAVPAGASASVLAPPGPAAHTQVIRAAAILAALVTASLGIGWLIAGRFLRPLRTITATARDISASNLNRRLALGGRDDEFAELGETLDGLFGRLEDSFESQRRFMANASHELRTPLAAERSLLQVALADPDASAETLRATCGELLLLSAHQERLIEALLTLASSEQGVDRWEPFDLADVAGQAVAARREEAGRREVRLDAALTAAPATGDPQLVESLVANLVDNAIRHNIAGGHAEISTAMTAGRAAITVRNTGIVVPPGQVDGLFQPFQRLGGERIRHPDGHGLGLAIVQAIAQAHGAMLTAQARPEGGLDIEVSFR
jgi:signal transduction histidine kinase